MQPLKVTQFNALCNNDLLYVGYKVSVESSVLLFQLSSGYSQDSSVEKSLSPRAVQSRPLWNCGSREGIPVLEEAGDQPFHGLTFCVEFPFSTAYKDKQLLKRMIIELGGTVSYVLTSKV